MSLPEENELVEVPHEDRLLGAVGAEVEEWPPGGETPDELDDLTLL